jgi:preprotein translocase subunit SecF
MWKSLKTALLMIIPMKIREFYEKNYKKLLFVPLGLFVAAVIFLIVFNSNTGDIMYKDVSLKGGISATIYTENLVDVDGLHKYLEDNLGESSVRKLVEFGSDKQLGILVEVDSTDETKLKEILQQVSQIELSDDNYSVEVAGASLGREFYRQMIKALIFALAFMAIVVFIVFRSFVPSLAVVFAAASDIIITIAIIDILGVKVSTAGIAAFLLLIGYSIDTDILLTTRILKRHEGSVMDRLVSSFKTGMTMTITTLVALTLGYIFTASLVLKEMFLIIIIGLLVDVIVTYLFNASVLLIRMERKHG